MSLLDGGANYQPCTVYPEETVTDVDGNTITRASSTGVSAMGRFQVQNQSGTSARNAEDTDDGFLTEQVYTVRFPRSFVTVLGAQAQIEWDGNRWSVFGDPQLYLGSTRTRHLQYVIRRS